MKYSVNKFFDKDECDYLIDFSMQNGEVFSYYKHELNSWDCRRIYDENFKNRVINKIKELYLEKKIEFWFNYGEFNIKNVNISLTRYYDGRYLDLHLDKTSNYTTVISLSDGYEDGDFCLSRKSVNIKDSDVKVHLNIGEGVTFEGNKIYHGVMPVFNGLRCALNIWINDTDFNYYKLDKEKKLI
jgi:predicted 2-oxoglutarate/Fe(II)-dependent dioxygenase YbiX